MLYDGLTLGQGADITNLVVDHGTADPSSPDVGELFYRTDLSTLRVYNGTAWTSVAAASGVTTVSVTTANGVSAVVTNPTTTPALAFTLGAITPTTVALTGGGVASVSNPSLKIPNNTYITFTGVGTHPANDAGITLDSSNNLAFVTSNTGRLWINADGSIGLGSVTTVGASGDVLTSRGTGVPPIWATPSGGVSSIAIASSTGITGSSTGGTTPTITLNLGTLTPTGNSLIVGTDSTARGTVTIGSQTTNDLVIRGGDAHYNGYVGGSVDIQAGTGGTYTGSAYGAGGNVSLTAGRSGQDAGTTGDIILYTWNGGTRIERLRVKGATGQWNFAGTAATAGQVLTTVAAGAAPVWAAPSASVTLATSQIGYGNASNALVGSPTFTYNDTTGVLGVGLTTGTTSAIAANYIGGAAPFIIRGADGVYGGPLLIRAGNNANTGTDTAGPNLTLQGGLGGSAYVGGSVLINAGLSTSPTGASGAITLQTGANTLSSRLSISATGVWSVGGAAPTATGQVLTANTLTGSPVWATPTGGGGTPGGSNYQVQYNASGAFAGNSIFTFDSTNNAFTAGVAQGVGTNAGDGGQRHTVGGNNASTLIANGQSATLTIANTGQTANTSSMLAFGQMTTAGGTVFANSTIQGFSTTVTSGQYSPNSFVVISATPATANTAPGEVIRFQRARIALNTGVALMVNGDSGTSGKILQSNGDGVSPTWVTPAAATFNGGTVSGATTFTSAGTGGTTATGAPQISLNGTVSNIIAFAGGSAGIAPPSFNNRSAGTKLVLFPNQSASAVDFGLGIDNNTLWSAVGDTGGSFKWYGGTTLAMTLTGAGNLTIVGDETHGSGKFIKFFNGSGNPSTRTMFTNANASDVYVSIGVASTSASQLVADYTSVVGNTGTTASVNATFSTNYSYTSIQTDMQSTNNGGIGSKIIAGSGGTGAALPLIFLLSTSAGVAAVEKMRIDTTGSLSFGGGNAATATGAGASGMVLTSNGASAAPTWQAAATGGTTASLANTTTIGTTATAMTLQGITSTGTSMPAFTIQGSYGNSNISNGGNLVLAGGASQSNTTGYVGGDIIFNTSQNQGANTLITRLAISGVTGSVTLGSAANPIAFITNGTTGTAGQVLTSNSTGQPTWATPSSSFSGGTVSGATTFTSAAPQITIDNATSNIILMGTGGAAAPTVSPRSAGTKFVLYNSITASFIDYAMGVESNNMWFSVPQASQGFKWYGGAGNVMMSLLASVLTTPTLNVSSGALQVSGSVGTSGQVLTSNGTTASWQAAAGGTPSTLAATTTIGTTGSAAVLQMAVQTSAVGLTIKGPDNSNSAGVAGPININAGTNTSGTGNGGAININAGNSAGTGRPGGNVAITAGTGGSASAGGTTTLAGGVGNGAAGGATTVIGGASTGAFAAGTLTLSGGATGGTSGSTNGSVIITTGTTNSTGVLSGYLSFMTGATATSPVERLRILSGGAFSFGATGTNTGTSGQVLQSTGSGTPPTWADPAGGTATALANTTTLGTVTGAVNLFGFASTGAGTGPMTIAAGGSTGVGNVLNLFGGQAGAASTNGGAVVISGGAFAASQTTGNGGQASVAGGAGSSGGVGGNVIIASGAGGTSGSITFSTGGTGGTARVQIAATGAISQLAGWSDSALTSFTAALVINCAAVNSFNGTLTANTTVSFINIPVAGQVYTCTFFLKQDATGARTVVWPAGTKWAGGATPVLTSTSTKTDIISLTTPDGGATWYGAVVGLNF